MWSRWNGTILSSLLAAFSRLGLDADSSSTFWTFPIIAVAVKGLQGEERFINACGTGVCSLCVPSSGLAGWVGVSRGLCTTWYPCCALCLSTEGMELHLQGSSRGNLWLLDSPPLPPNIPIWINVRPHLPSHHHHHPSPHVPPPSYKSPDPLSLLCKTSLLCERPSRRAPVLGVVSDFRTWRHGPRAHFNYVHSGNICHRCLLWENTSQYTNKQS